MEQYLRIALWTFLLLGYLQAKPCRVPVPSDLCFDCLRDDVKCKATVTFASPTNVKKHCHNAALTCFKKELERANLTCTDENYRISDTLHALEQYKPDCSQDTQTNSTDCQWEDEGSRKQFADFVKDFKSFTQLLLNQNITVVISTTVKTL